MKRVCMMLFITIMTVLVSCAHGDGAGGDYEPLENLPIPFETARAEVLIPEIAPEEFTPPLSSVDKMVESMSVDEKLGQLFICAFRKDGLGKAYTGLGEAAKNAIEDYHIGGVVLFKENIQSVEQVTDYIGEMQSIAAIPLFISIDEEGGMVRRTGNLGIADTGSQLSVAKGGAEAVYQAADDISNYLKPLGFNLNFAPVADIYSNPRNMVIADRAFGMDEATVSAMVPHAVRAYNDNGIISALKHFPGHGDTIEDSHGGPAYIYKSLEELRQMELKPFEAGIKEGVPMVMAGHISTPNICGDEDPACLCPLLITEILRGEMGFQGLVITDALDMGALSAYDDGEIAVRAFEAGVDILLMPKDLGIAFKALKDALDTGRIDMQQLNEKVSRILTYKESYLEFPAHVQ